MLIGFLTVIFVFLCLLLMLIIFVQRGKGSMGIGTIGGSTQMLFGGSGGQDLFQKITWVLAAIFMASSLGLALLTTRSYHESRYLDAAQRPIQYEQPASSPE